MSEDAKREYKLETGTIFAPDSAAQYAFDFIIKCVKNGVKSSTKIKAGLSLIRKENGYRFNLDSTYFNYCIRKHPEFLTRDEFDNVQILKEPCPQKRKVVISKMMDKAKKAKNLQSEVKKQKKGYGF